MRFSILPAPHAPPFIRLRIESKSGLRLLKSQVQNRNFCFRTSSIMANISRFLSFLPLMPQL
ncbi:hypothetical protein LEP1GSC047_0343 [Leptospira inadai serovar Lyme str. 10]|uniref:Uncharacterized protein n=1 Tax=Leptospira inadai serovar Lyme str. 10 TaxID=1049790 RepID=V6HTB9_9LEPT|nr:hypothetical protein LEP1GSC047_0343 [Leptospira inadai serovar Lyme str. 10]